VHAYVTMMKYGLVYYKCDTLKAYGKTEFRTKQINEIDVG